MCFEKGLITSNIHRLKSGKISFNLRSFNNDGHIVIAMKHKKGYARLILQIGEKKPEVIDVIEDVTIYRNIEKGEKVSITIELSKHYGAYKVLKKEGKINGTSIK